MHSLETTLIDLSDGSRTFAVTGEPGPFLIFDASGIDGLPADCPSMLTPDCWWAEALYEEAEDRYKQHRRSFLRAFLKLVYPELQEEEYWLKAIVLELVVLFHEIMDYRREHGSSGIMQISKKSRNE